MQCEFESRWESDVQVSLCGCAGVGVWTPQDKPPGCVSGMVQSDAGAPSLATQRPPLQSLQGPVGAVRCKLRVGC